ncbi:probable deoxyuridine 5'-triphosphate nucleotidohydrolase [Methanocella paludicola SANAE]|uniref:Probable deoxyuridine 5'-triphosphate nucleotidohydrolase n=1 Tax=Methanocella paludicola (strain DSM 17711 / JCM 13418 / NBRC 101707 / SANAE) TaxID=304371 RepID=D1YW94_METPS|nr:deoxyuridine 5'-triphosphate nucleotidohydrolase [Methanocella paludicola]BAI60716.1 probable deoxyuridine 5'-triphosphate nucleotidohydrolase [Methanocella paludicola SANAE]
MILGKTELIKLLDSLVEGAVDAQAQVQPNGFELTAGKIEAFEGAGGIGFSNDDRALPSTKPLEWGRDGWLLLAPGCYKVVFNEVVSIPKDVCAIGLPRSSLLRMGVSVHTAVWDAGYRGRSEALLVVYNQGGFRIKKSARIIQLLFMRLESGQEGYSGRYMNENV